MTKPGSQERRFGVLIPVTSLPGPAGVGTLGEPAEDWLEWLAAAGASAWQLLPLGPPGRGDSPYSALSSFAGNPLLVSVERLMLEDWARDAIDAMGPRDEPNRRADWIDYGRVARRRDGELRALWAGFGLAPAERRRAFEDFRRDAARQVWLDDWCLFAAVSAELGRQRPDGRPPTWLDWPEDLRCRDASALGAVRASLADEVDYHAFVQCLFHEQLLSLRRRAHRLGVELLGDLPYYPGLESADVWSRPQLFALDADSRPERVAGVPPDAFTDEGQLWGNVVLRWREQADDCRRWWIDRVRAGLLAADRLRLDHFRGYEAYWSVPSDAESAVEGRWEPGPGIELFDAARREFGGLPFLAEDLGYITDAVRELLSRTGIPGMRVLQFAFAEEDSDHLPHAVTERTVLCTATHDNDTARGWFEGLEGTERERALTYLKGDPETIHLDLLRAALDSPAALVLAPIQDILGLGSEARLNTPGLPTGQWRWRLDRLPAPSVATRLRSAIETAGRAPGTVGS